MKADPKTTAALVIGLGKLKGKSLDEGEEPEGEEADDEMSSDEDSAASEVMQAIKEQDVSALKDALKAFVGICMHSEED